MLLAQKFKQKYYKDDKAIIYIIADNIKKYEKFDRSGQGSKFEKIESNLVV